MLARPIALPRPVFSYTRLSTPEQLKGSGLTRQLEMARAYCAKHALLS